MNTKSRYQTKAIDPLLRCKTTHFNAAGQVTQVEDALSNSTYYYYDVLGHKTRVKDALNNEVDFEFDLAGNVTRIINAKDNNFARFEYSVTNRRTLEKDALDNTTTFEYDLNGNLTKKTDGNSDTIEYQYDAANRLLLRDYPNGGDDVTYEYDCLGLQTKVYTSSVTFEYEYDLAGRITKKEDTTESLAMAFEYDAGGRRTKMTGPESGETTWEYSVADHLTKITNPEADVTEFEHDAAGQRTKLKYNNGAYTDYTRDDAGHILTLHNRTSTDATISKFEYEYDLIGNRTKMVVDDSDTTMYEYDDTYQLTKVAYPGGAVHDFAYGASGNRTDWDITPGPSYNYYYDSANQLTNMTVNGTTWSYYYDGAHGTRKTHLDLRRNEAPRTCRARLVCRRDAQAAPRPMVRERRLSAYDGRLYGVNKNTSNVLTNTFNPDGTRRSLGNGGTINFLYDGQNVLAEYDSSWANPDVTYTHGPGIDEPLVMTSWNYAQEPASHTEYYLHHDALGSTRQLTNSDDSTVTTYSYDAWGKTTESTIVGSVSCPFRYTGREWDDAAEMYYLRARYYNHQLGRFVSRDPWPGNSFANPYVYAGNSPTLLVDRLGLFKYPSQLGDILFGGDNWDAATLDAVTTAGKELERRSRAGSNADPCVQVLNDYGHGLQFDEWSDNITFRYDDGSKDPAHACSGCRHEDGSWNPDIIAHTHYFGWDESWDDPELQDDGEILRDPKADPWRNEICICDKNYKSDAFYESYVKYGTLSESDYFQSIIAHEYSHAVVGTIDFYTIEYFTGTIRADCPYEFEITDCKYAHWDADFFGIACLPGISRECLYDKHGNNCFPERIQECRVWAEWMKECIEYCRFAHCSPDTRHRCECYECCRVPKELCEMSRLWGWGGYQGSLAGTKDPQACNHACCHSDLTKDRPPTCPVSPKGSNCRGPYTPPAKTYCGITGSRHSGAGRHCIYNVCEAGGHHYYYPISNQVLSAGHGTVT